MMEQEENSGSGRSRVSRKRIVYALAAILASIAASAGIVLVPKLHEQETKQSIPATQRIKSQVNGFTAYYPAALPANFSVKESTITYDRDTLLYNLSDSKNTISITQQPVPSDLSPSSIIGKETLPTGYGKATISLVDNRTIGYLITNDRKTMIILNTADAVSLSTFKDIIRSLRPL
jgi:hypothetical protein